MADEEKEQIAALGRSMWFYLHTEVAGENKTDNYLKIVKNIFQTLRNYLKILPIKKF